MKFTVKQDMKIVRRGGSKHDLQFLAGKIGVTPKQLQERIDYLYSEKGRDRLEYIWSTLHKQTMKLREFWKRERYERANQWAVENGILLPAENQPIKEQHIDNHYIKDAMREQYLAMRRRERRSNDGTGNFCL